MSEWTFSRVGGETTLLCSILCRCGTISRQIHPEVTQTLAPSSGSLVNVAFKPEHASYSRLLQLTCSSVLRSRNTHRNAVCNVCAWLATELYLFGVFDFRIALHIIIGQLTAYLVSNKLLLRCYRLKMLYSFKMCACGQCLHRDLRALNLCRALFISFSRLPKMAKYRGSRNWKRRYVHALQFLIILLSV